MPIRDIKSLIKSTLKAHPTIYSWAKRRYGAFYHRSAEDWLADFAKRRRDVFFFQIGAHDGKTDDILHLLVRERQWRGVLVEPVKYLFDRLVSNYAGTQGLIFENKALKAKDGAATFYFLRQTNDDPVLPHWYDQLGSFNRDVVLSHKAVIPNIEDYLIEESVECVSFDTLVARYKVNRIDLILIDTEGYDFEVLRNIDFHRYRPKLIIYEHKHLSSEDKAEAIRLLKCNGYIVRPARENNVAIRSLVTHFLPRHFSGK
jgi:FkbM family methyltransferase